MQNKGCVPGEIISPSDRVVVDDGMVKTQSLMNLVIPDWGCEDRGYLLQQSKLQVAVVRALSSG